MHRKTTYSGQEVHWEHMLKHLKTEMGRKDHVFSCTISPGFLLEVSITSSKNPARLYTRIHGLG